MMEYNERITRVAFDCLEEYKETERLLSEYNALISLLIKANRDWKRYGKLRFDIKVRCPESKEVHEMDSVRIDEVRLANVIESELRQCVISLNKLKCSLTEELRERASNWSDDIPVSLLNDINDTLNHE